MRRLLVVAGVAAAVSVVGAAPASAHPLGNFTINHYDGITLTASAVDVLAVVDAAEIPTAQQRSAVDTDRDGTLEASERASYASALCPRVAAAERLTVDGRAVPLTVTTSSLSLRPGAAGLPTSRLVCDLHARAALTDADHRVTLADEYDAAHLGWREMTLRCDGVHVSSSPIPAHSVSDELRHYPNDLLSAPLDVRRATLDVVPGSGSSTFAPALRVPGAGPLSRAVERLSNVLTGLTGAHRLTLGVGMLAVLVSLLLGATHAALPGHGKTVVAAYVAGRSGGVRDAVVVGATVTVTHTAGVLVLGLALSLSSSLAGDHVERLLGVGSGALIAVVGAGLLVAALRRRHPQHHDHDHGHGHDHGHDHGHGHHHDHHQPDHAHRGGLVGLGVAGGLVPSPSALVVLLGAIALGRTAFGVLLVLTYGLGMAATLTAAGLAAVRLRDRWAPRLSRLRMARRLGTATPFVTAGLVLVVGVGVAVRGLAVL